MVDTDSLDARRRVCIAVDEGNRIVDVCIVYFTSHQINLPKLDCYVGGRSVIPKSVRMHGYSAIMYFQPGYVVVSAWPDSFDPVADTFIYLQLVDFHSFEIS